MLHALANGWRPDEISHTGTNVSERDLDVLLAHPIHLNLDAVSQLERVGRRAPGRTVGIRVNPGAGAGYTEHLAYAGDRPTKFGVTEDRLDDAISLTSFLIGIGKAPVFAVIIALVGCYQGFQVSGSAESVGRQTTVSVVQSIFLVILVDALFSIVFSWLKL